MTLHAETVGDITSVWIGCDGEPCEQRVEGDKLPDDWEIVVRANTDPYAARSASLHYCPAHVNGSDHLVALRSRA